MALGGRATALIAVLAVGSLALAALAFGAVDLVRRSTVTPATPFTPAQRLADYRRAIEASYGGDALVFPNPATNSLGFSAIADAAAWQANVNACFAVNRVRGVHAGPDFTIVGAPQQGDDTTEPPGFFACVVRYPSPSQLDQRMSPAQLSALYDYYVTSAVPCMLAAGIPLPVIPGRAKFVADFSRQLHWHPFTAPPAGTSNPAVGPPSPQEVDRLARLCPPEPKWLAGTDGLLH